MKRNFWVATIALALALSPLAEAQTLDSGQIRGVVYDQTKAPIPGATLTLKNDQTGFSRVVVTSGAGAYQFPQIPVGDYKLLVELEG